MASYTVTNFDKFGELILDWSTRYAADSNDVPTDINDFMTEAVGAGIVLDNPAAVTKVYFCRPAASDEIRVVLSHPAALTEPVNPGPNGEYPLKTYYDSAYKYDDRQPMAAMNNPDADTFRMMRIGEYSSSKCM